MNERISIANKKPQIKGQNQLSQIHKKPDDLLSMNTPVDRILFLQRTIGNQAIAGLIGSKGLQAKLRIRAPGDIYEQEADRVADRVMRMAEQAPIGSAPAAIHRKCASSTQRSPSLDAQRPSKGVITHTSVLQGVEGQDEEYPLSSQAVIFRKEEFALPQRTTAPAAPITDRLVGLQAGGEVLPAVTRHKMEKAFGYDFSRVRVHRDAEAGEISQQLSALAFTHGSHIYFGNRMYDPAGSSGKRLLSHELAHVVQQGHAAILGNRIGSTISSAIQSSVPTIQCFSYFEGGTVHQDNNLADTVLHGKDAGTTFFVLNGSKITKTAAQVRAALKRPTLSFSPVTTGGFDARVKTVPTNKGGYDETVLAARRWILNVPKSTVLANFPDLATCRGAGNTIFQAIGMPSDAAIFAANRRHEDHHVDDFFSAFMSTIYWWDTALDVAAGSATPYHGLKKADAEAALYTEMGGTPDQIADKYADTAAAAIETYHNTPEGGPIKWDIETANADARCTTSSVECTNPS